MYGKQNKKEEMTLDYRNIPSFPLCHAIYYSWPACSTTYSLDFGLSNRLTHACYFSYSDLPGHHDSKMSITE